MNYNKMFDGPKVSLDEVLDNRTRRVQRQRAMLAETNPCCLISFTLNIPGDIKSFSLSKAAFHEGLVLLRESFGERIIKEKTVQSSSGTEALLALDLAPQPVKERTVAIENMHPLGRLFDMDVLDGNGVSISRLEIGKKPRRCLLCKENAKICARSRTHSLNELRFEVARQLNEYFREQAADKCTYFATKALLYEVSTTPKPGLVDLNNSGSHQDMDYFTFLDSTSALVPWLRKMYCIGWDSGEESPKEIFESLRYVGQQAERAMLQATKGVNTHKGLIFSLGLICGALGATRFGFMTGVSVQEALKLCAEMGFCALNDFSDEESSTNGKRCYREFGIQGIRGEVAMGFPVATRIGLPMLKKWTEEGLTINDAATITLLSLIAETTDTNLIHRGGRTRAERCKTDAQKLLREVTPTNALEVLKKLDEEYIKENLSPGGSADNLAISLMLYFLE